MSTPCAELEDIGTLCLIHEAGIQDIVLLSKADLLREEDRLASIEYIQSQNSRSTAARDAVQLSKLLKSGVLRHERFLRNPLHKDLGFSAARLLHERFDIFW